MYVRILLRGHYDGLTSQQFVQYDQRAHQLQNLASFSFWVHSMFTNPLTYVQILIPCRRSAVSSPTDLPASFPPDCAAEKSWGVLPIRRVEDKCCRRGGTGVSTASIDRV